VTGLGTFARYVEARHEIVIDEAFENHPHLDEIIVHELVHVALLGHGLKPPDVGKDNMSAPGPAALVEGDAELVEAGFAAQRLGRPPRRAMASVTRVHAPWTPLGCRRDGDPVGCAQAAAVYAEGRAFASALYRVGGTPILDAAYKTPPSTLFEVVYPDLYLAGVREQRLTELEPALVAAGIKTTSVEAIGAFRLARALATEIDRERIRLVFHDFRGDVCAYLEGGGQIFLTAWADGRAPGLAAASFSPSQTVLMPPRHLLFGIGVEKDVLEKVAKRIVAKGLAPLPSPSPPSGTLFPPEVRRPGL
jgi:hypothetical protein